MRPGQRLALGALIGALATLVFAPYTRPFIFSGFAPWGLNKDLMIPSKLTADPGLNESAAWVETWAQKIARRRSVSTEDLLKVLTVARRAAEKEPENAYWWQSVAVLESARGNAKAAEAAWKQGAKQSLWNDYQYSRLEARRHLADPLGHGWSYALAYGQYDLSVLERIQGYARSLIRTAPLETSDGLTRRVDTLKNGQLIRNRARAVAVGEYGVEIIELAAYPPDLAPINNPSKLILARMYFHDQLRARKRDLDASIVDACYRANDGWTAFASSDVALQNATSLGMALLVSTCFAGGMLWAAIVGLFLWGVGWLTSRSESGARVWRSPWCILIGLILGGAVGLGAGSIPAGLGVLGAFAFLAWQPPKVRYSGELVLGPLYGFLVMVFGVLTTIAAAALAIGSSRVGWSLAYRLGAPDEYYGFPPMAVGLAAIGIGFAIALAPAYAWAYRIDPPRLASLTLEIMGRRMFAVCSLLIVLSVPVALYAEQTLGDEMRKIFSNEPNYYLQQ